MATIEIVRRDDNERASLPFKALPFEYQALDQTSGTVRFIHVDPASRDGKIRVRISHNNIYKSNDGSPTRYCCLSYTWGDPNEDFEIYINGQPMRVRSNLYQFLKVAERRFNNQNLWIDALCINQSDNVEKSYQVQQMGHIYSQASKVFIWIGVEPELYPIFDLARKCASNSLESWRGFTSRLSYKVNQSRRGIREFEKGLLRICSNNYWTRAWIVQEILMPRDENIEIVNGQRSLNWNELAAALIETVARIKVKHGQKSALEDSLFWTYRKLTLSIRSSTAHNPIWTLINAFGNLGCMDKRDHIYAFINLVEKSESPLRENTFETFAVNYSEDAHSLFWRAGDHFQAWAMQANIRLLSSTLGLTSQNLKDDLNITERAPAILRIYGLTFPRQTYLNGKKRNAYPVEEPPPGDWAECSRCKRKIVRRTEGDILVCSTYLGIDIGYGGHYETSHAVLSPKGKASFSVYLSRPDPDDPLHLLDLGPEVLFRCNQGIWTQAGRLPEDDGLESFQRPKDEHVPFRIHLPLHVILDSI